MHSIFSEVLHTKAQKKDRIIFGLQKERGIPIINSDDLLLGGGLTSRTCVDYQKVEVEGLSAFSLHNRAPAYTQCRRLQHSNHL